MANYNYKTIEPEIIDFWNKNQIYPKAKEKNKGKKTFTYLDGPPYTSGKIHLGTAWGKSIRDSVMRFKRMNGFDVWDRAGFDMHGLPTENKVAEKFNFSRKDEIEEYGVEKFQLECEKFCTENMRIMIKDFKRIGVWMDFDNPYMPIKPEFMAGEWFLAKKAYDSGRLYEGAKVMTWCAKCATSLSKHELEYQNVEDKSVFVKLKIKDSESDYLIVWTTTPWTLPFNLAVMVNPTLDYVKVKTEDDNNQKENWIIAKGLVGVLMGMLGKKYEIIEEFKGEKLEGTKYCPLFSSHSPIYEELQSKYEHAFSVLLSEEFVDLSAGSGLVHCAPGCGPEDQIVGNRYGLPAFNETDEYGTFKESMKDFSGLRAKLDDKIFIEHIKNHGSLLESTPVEHDYAHCWRCKSPVIFRTTKQWFFKVEDLRERMLELNSDTRWVPESAFNAFESWLKNIRDNGITRQRFWGTPVPIWKCDTCSNIDVVGSIDELEKKAGRLPENFHKPWIDEINWKCDCGGTMNRIPDIFDVWIDAGCAGWICYDYPQRTDLFEKWFPADFITEGKDQIRGWFNLLMVASTLAFDKKPFKSVYMHGFINDYRGIKMSKSLGNVTDPFEIIDEYGADVLRYYTISAARPGTDMNYNPEDTKVKMKNLLILWNLHNLLKDSIVNTGIKPAKDFDKGIEEEYILSKLNSGIKKVTENFENLYIDEIPQVIEDLYLDVSRNYVQYVRERLAIGTDEDKKTVISTLAICIEKIIKLFAPIAPFITEKMYQDIKDDLALVDESVHLADWPQYDSGLIDEELEDIFDTAGRVIQATLRGREIAQIGVRWPLKEIIIASKEEKISMMIEKLEEVIKGQVNCKRIKLVERFDKAKIKVRADYKKMGPAFADKTPQIIAELLKCSPETIKSKIESEGKYQLKIGKDSFDILEDHLIVESVLPDNFEAGEFKEGMVYINKDSNKELEGEGYAREVMRRVQNLRRQANLSKADVIELTLSAEDGLKDMLEPWFDKIKEKVGARSLSFGETDHKEKIKDIQVGISFKQI